jgi:hypothetical protein
MAIRASEPIPGSLSAAMIQWGDETRKTPPQPEFIRRGDRGKFPFSRFSDFAIYARPDFLWQIAAGATGWNGSSRSFLPATSPVIAAF